MQFLNLINQSEDNMKHGRWVELIVLFVGVPFVLAVCLPPRALYPVLAVSGVSGSLCCILLGDSDGASCLVPFAGAKC